MKIIIETIKHEEQRYDTVGDWFYGEDGTLHIKVSKLPTYNEEFLIAIHELIECAMCKHNGISQEQVDDFDTRFEANRAPGNVEEPGDMYNAPYHKEHSIASGIERIVAAELEVDWLKYEDNIDAL